MSQIVQIISFKAVFIPFILFATESGSSIVNDRPPNVIVILADDMGVGDLAVFNGGLNRTPNLDKLVSQSVWFSQAYSASAVCAPARASLMTGRYPHRTGVVGLNMEKFPSLTSLNLGEVTVADIFLDNGYRTGIIGKWHLGDRPAYHPMRRGFEEFAGFIPPSSIRSYYDYQLDVNGEKKSFEGGYLTDVLTDYTIDFVNRHQTSPFFLHLAYYAPHRPLGAPKDLVESYRNEGYDLQVAQIYAMIEVMDAGIGRLLDELDRLGLHENTLIVFASDNGPDPLTGERYNHHLRGSKYEVFEGGIRVPLLFHWKNMLSNGKYEEVVHFTDILPTILGLSDLTVRDRIVEHFDGISLADVLLGRLSAVDTKARYWQWNRGIPFYSHNAAIRDGDWKLVYPPIKRGIVDSPSNEKAVLFNIKHDPSESVDVSAKHPDVLLRMKTMLVDWSRKMEFDRLRATLFDN